MARKKKWRSLHPDGWEEEDFDMDPYPDDGDDPYPTEDEDLIHEDDLCPPDHPKNYPQGG